MHTIKNYYLEVLKHIDPEIWTTLREQLLTTQDRKITSIGDGVPISRANSAPIATLNAGSSISRVNTAPETETTSTAGGSGSGIHLTTADAHTLTDGPTIYLAEDVNRVARFYLQQSNIPESMLARLNASIKYNNRISKQIEKLQKSVEDATAKDSEKENKLSSEHRLSAAVQQMLSEIATLRRGIQIISLDEVYIPNTLAHQTKWVGRIVPAAFKGDIDEQTVEEIVNLPQISNSWKILLLMGIGVFAKDSLGASEYVEIMKKLAYQQKLYMIIASSDYIYGTNYQFCHGIIGKDLSGLTQQKMIQALGRIGRNNIQQDYTIRFREDEMIAQLFQPSSENIEAVNMSRLFCS